MDKKTTVGLKAWNTHSVGGGVILNRRAGTSFAKCGLFTLSSPKRKLEMAVTMEGYQLTFYIS